MKRFLLLLPLVALLGCEVKVDKDADVEYLRVTIASSSVSLKR